MTRKKYVPQPSVFPRDQRKNEDNEGYPPLISPPRISVSESESASQSQSALEENDAARNSIWFRTDRDSDSDSDPDE